MRIAFDINMSDAEVLCKHFAETNKTVKRSKIILISVFVFLLIVSLYPSLCTGEIDYIEVIIAALLPMIGIIYVVGFYTKRVSYRMKKDLSNPMNTNFFGPCEMILEEEGITINRTTSSGNLKWEAIKQLDETPGYFFLYVGSNSAYAIPKKKISANEVGELSVLFEKCFQGTINTFRK